MTETRFKLPTGPAICYSGYREGQSPGDRIYPSNEQIREDLHMLLPHWRLLRLYDCSAHAERVLQVIQEDRLPFQVMLGAYLAAEASNPGCPWGGLHSEEQLAANRLENRAECERLVRLADAHGEHIFSLAVGNEATVGWTDHLVPVDAMIDHVRWVKARARQPVTFCENYVPWMGELDALAAELDILSVHTYPLWEHKPIHEALAYTQDNVLGVVRRHPGKPVIISEAGWCTRSNGRGMRAEDANEGLQAIYLQQLMAWADSAGLLCFVFEAFDEPWKGSPDPLEPEKHWGLYTVGRQPKQAALALAPLPAAAPHNPSATPTR